jgi:HEPN domain-containing protein
LIPEKVQKWIDRVNYDYETAEAMFQTGRYIYSIFMCQQAIEKCFKGLIAYYNEEVFPIHNLRRLAELARVINELTDEKVRKLDYLSQFYLNARYKEDIVELSKKSSKDITLEFLNFTQDIIKWLMKKIF